MATDTQSAVEVHEEMSRPTEPAAVHADARRMFEWSRFIHVGPGAAECEAVNEAEFECSCSNPLHFHAWIRLPNKLQHKDIRDTGMAAKARKMRALQDPESDSRMVLEAELMDVRQWTSEEDIANELLAKDWASDLTEAMTDVREREEFELIDKDRERLAELLDQYEGQEEIPSELTELNDHVERYRDAINERVEELRGPKLHALLERGKDALVDLLREKRILAEGDAEFLHVYNLNQWWICTLVISREEGNLYPHMRKFSSIAAMNASAPEVIEAIEAGYSEIEIALQRGVQGNS